MSQELSALLGTITVIVAGTVAILAFFQYEVARAKLKFDLFEQRYAIFLIVWEFTSACAVGGDEDRKLAGRPFHAALPRARFLFGDDLSAYLKLLSDERHRLDVSVLTISLKLAPEEAEEREKAIADHVALAAFFEGEANQGCKDRFAPYLDFSKWK